MWSYRNKHGFISNPFLVTATMWACWRSGCGAGVYRQGALWPHWSPSSRQCSCCRWGKRPRRMLRGSSGLAVPCPASRWVCLSTWILLGDERVCMISLAAGLLFCLTDREDFDPLHPPQRSGWKSHSEFHTFCSGTVCRCKVKHVPHVENILHPMFLSAFAVLGASQRPL